MDLLIPPKATVIIPHSASFSCPSCNVHCRICGDGAILKIVKFKTISIIYKDNMSSLKNNLSLWGVFAFFQFFQKLFLSPAAVDGQWTPLSEWGQDWRQPWRNAWKCSTSAHEMDPNWDVQPLNTNGSKKYKYCLLNLSNGNPFGSQLIVTTLLLGAW